MPMIKELVEVVSRIDPDTGKPIKTNQQKIYLILLFLNNDDKIFDIFYSRLDAFNFCCIYAENSDIVQSQVFTQNHTMKNSISVFSFMKTVLEYDDEINKNSEITEDELIEIALQYTEDVNEVLEEDGFEV